MRHLAPILVLTVAALSSACSRPAPPPEPVRAVRTITVSQQSAGTSIDYAGEVRARTESRLSFRVAGKMVSRPVDLGDVVKAGQVLASLDPMDLRLGQQAASSGLEAARVNAEQANADLKRFKELREQGFISAAELDRRESTFKAAQAQYEQARAQASVQTNQARYTTLVADGAGVVGGHDAGFHRRVLTDEGVHFVFHLRQIGGRDCMAMAEVKAQPVGRNKRTLLRHVRAQHLAQRLVQ